MIYPIELQYFMNHDFYKAKGKITNLNAQNKYIEIAGQYLPIDSIIDVWID